MKEAAKAAAGGSALTLQKAVLLVLHMHPSKPVSRNAVSHSLNHHGLISVHFQLFLFFINIEWTSAVLRSGKHYWAIPDDMCRSHWEGVRHARVKRPRLRDEGSSCVKLQGQAAKHLGTREKKTLHLLLISTTHLS